MEIKPYLFDSDGYRCEERCTLERAECVEKEDGAAICKTRERNCVDECRW
jgi:hypothetical protein